jgi:hypothetical protein
MRQLCDRLAVLALKFADQFSESILDGDLLTHSLPIGASLDDPMRREYIDLNTAREIDQIEIDEAVEYLELRGLIVRHDKFSNLVRVEVTK